MASAPSPPAAPDAVEAQPGAADPGPAPPPASTAEPPQPGPSAPASARDEGDDSGRAGSAPGQAGGEGTPSAQAGDEGAAAPSGGPKGLPSLPSFSDPFLKRAEPDSDDASAAEHSDTLDRSASGRLLNAAAPEFIPRALSGSLSSPSTSAPASAFSFAAPMPAYPSGAPQLPFAASNVALASQPLLPLPFMGGAHGAQAGHVPVLPGAAGAYPLQPGPVMGAGGGGAQWQTVQGHHHHPHHTHAHHPDWNGQGHGQGQGQGQGQGHGPNDAHHGPRGPHPKQGGRGSGGTQGAGAAGGSKKGNQEAADAHFKGLAQEDADTLRANILRQVEFYFSDNNLAGDNHLQKLIKQDPDGFVHLRAILEFKKMKSMVPAVCAGTPAFVAFAAAALGPSESLVLNEHGNKVRRAMPLAPVDSEEVQRRTVIAENLPQDHSIAAMEELFGKAGKVQMVRICTPQAANGANRSPANKNRLVVTNKLHALIEYATPEEAEAAAAQLNDSNNWRSGLHVRVLLAKAPKGLGKHNTFQHHPQHQHPHQPGKSPPRRSPQVSGLSGITKEHAPDGAQAALQPQAAGADEAGVGGERDRNGEEAHGETDPASADPGHEGGGNRKGRAVRKSKGNKGKGDGSSKSPARSKSPAHYQHHPHHHLLGKDGSHSPLGTSPIRSPGLGHGFAHRHGHSGSPMRGATVGAAAATGDAAHVAKPLPGPRMPDGTKGFSMGRGKPVAPPPPQ